MHSFSILSVVAAAAVAMAENVITFKSVDDVSRTVAFTPSVGNAEHPDVKVPAGGSVDVTMPHGWVGNAWSYHDGKPRVPGMLAEFTFNGWNDITYYDVSAIVNPDDHDNVATIEPVGGAGEMSGCSSAPHFPCTNVYMLPDDIQTKTTSTTNKFVVTLSMNHGSKKRDIPSRVGRSYVLGQHAALEQ